MAEEKDTHFLSYPEVRAALDAIYPSLLAESDRGAILVALSVLDNNLDIFFQELVPAGTSNKRKKDIFNRTGPFGSLSSKLDIAYACQMLPGNVVEAIHMLRKIRNEAAHGSSDFKIADYFDRIRDAYSTIGSSIPAGLHGWATTMISQQFMESLESLTDPDDPEKPLFKNREEIIKSVEENPRAIDSLNEKLPKQELVIAVYVLCGIIHMWKRRFLKRNMEPKTDFATDDVPSNK